MADAMRMRAADEIDRKFEHNRDELVLWHRRGEQAQLNERKAQLHGFARNREAAELRYVCRMRQIEERKDRAADRLRQQQNSIGGRLARLTKAGRNRQAAQWERLDERALQLQARATRNFNALTERQFQAEQKDRIFYARHLKLMRLENYDERQKHRQNHLATREQRIDERAQAMKRAEAERAFRNELRPTDRQHTRARTR